MLYLKSQPSVALGIVHSLGCWRTSLIKALWAHPHKAFTTQTPHTPPAAWSAAQRSPIRWTMECKERHRREDIRNQAQVQLGWNAGEKEGKEGEQAGCVAGWKSPWERMIEIMLGCSVVMGKEAWGYRSNKAFSFSGWVSVLTAGPWYSS